LVIWVWNIILFAKILVPGLSLKTGGTTGTWISCFILIVRVPTAVVRVSINTATVIEARGIIIATAVAAAIK